MFGLAYCHNMLIDVVSGLYFEPEAGMDTLLMDISSNKDEMKEIFGVMKNASRVGLGEQLINLPRLKGLKDVLSKNLIIYALDIETISIDGIL